MPHAYTKVESCRKQALKNTKTAKYRLINNITNVSIQVAR